MPNRYLDIMPNSANPNPAMGAGVVNAPQTAFALLNSFAIAAASLGMNITT